MNKCAFPGCKLPAMYCDSCSEPDHSECVSVDDVEASKIDAVTRVQDWVDREKVMGRLSPTELVEFDRCIEDLR